MAYTFRGFRSRAGMCACRRVRKCGGESARRKMTSLWTMAFSHLELSVARGVAVDREVRVQEALAVRESVVAVQRAEDRRRDRRQRDEAHEQRGLEARLARARERRSPLRGRLPRPGSERERGRAASERERGGRARAHERERRDRHDQQVVEEVVPARGGARGSRGPSSSDATPVVSPRRFTRVLFLSSASARARARTNRAREWRATRIPRVALHRHDVVERELGDRADQLQQRGERVRLQ